MFWVLLGTATPDSRPNGEEPEKRWHESLPEPQVLAREHRSVEARQPQRSRLDARSGFRDCFRRESTHFVRHFVERPVVVGSLLRQSFVESWSAFRRGRSSHVAREGRDDAKVFLSQLRLQVSYCAYSRLHGFESRSIFNTASKSVSVLTASTG